MPVYSSETLKPRVKTTKFSCTRKINILRILCIWNSICKPNADPLAKHLGTEEDNPSNQIASSLGAPASRSSSYETGTLSLSRTDTCLLWGFDWLSWVCISGISDACCESFEKLAGVPSSDEFVIPWDGPSFLWYAGGCLLNGCLNCFCMRIKKVQKN